MFIPVLAINYKLGPHANTTVSQSLLKITKIKIFLIQNPIIEKSKMLTLFRSQSLIRSSRGWPFRIFSHPPTFWCRPPTNKLSGSLNRKFWRTGDTPDKITSFQSDSAASSSRSGTPEIFTHLNDRRSSILSARFQNSIHGTKRETFPFSSSGIIFLLCPTY